MAKVSELLFYDNHEQIFCTMLRTKGSPETSFAKVHEVDSFYSFYKWFLAAVCQQNMLKIRLLDNIHMELKNLGSNYKK